MLNFDKKTYFQNHSDQLMVSNILYAAEQKFAPVGTRILFKDENSSYYETHDIKRNSNEYKMLEWIRKELGLC